MFFLLPLLINLVYLIARIFLSLTGISYLLNWKMIFLLPILENHYQISLAYLLEDILLVATADKSLADISYLLNRKVFFLAIIIDKTISYLIIRRSSCCHC